MEDRLLKHGRFSWNELMTTDVEGATLFYGNLFGWEFDAFPVNGATYHVIRAGSEESGGIMPIAQQAEGHPPAWGIYVTVDDVDKTARQAEELGGKIHLPPTDIPGVGRFAVLEDPQGALISIITYARK